MPLLFWVVPYLIAGGVMWFVAHQIAPIGREIPLSRAILAVFLMGACSMASGVYLKPLIGFWRWAPEFIIHALIVMAVLKLSFWRSILGVTVYWIVMAISIVLIAIGSA